MYQVKEIFYSLQGEGFHTGRPAVFVRFSGCNLWSGREQDRIKGPGPCSAWCDTDFVGTDGPNGGKFSSARELANAVARVFGWDARDPMTFKTLCVCTGGEPLLQLDDAAVAALQSFGVEVAVETNGTLPAPGNLNWITVSPKAGQAIVQQTGDELKLVFPQVGAEPSQYEDLAFRQFYLQPLAGPNGAENTALAVRYCLDHPKWRFSLQAHKILGIS